MISVEKPGSPAEMLEHFGKKGMKWGVRTSRNKKPPLKSLIHEPIVRKTKNGDTFTLTPQPTNIISRTLARISPKYRESYKSGAYLNITDKSGKNIGDFMINRRPNKELYVNWVGIKPSARGHGYATAVMKESIAWSRKNGMKKVTLEVPGNAPDARHIYEKMGFKAGKVILPATEKDGSPEMQWGGLTEMEYES